MELAYGSSYRCLRDAEGRYKGIGCNIDYMGLRTGEEAIYPKLYELDFWGYYIFLLNIEESALEDLVDIFLPILKNL